MSKQGAVTAFKQAVQFAIQFTNVKNKYSFSTRVEEALEHIEAANHFLSILRREHGVRGEHYMDTRNHLQQAEVAIKSSIYGRAEDPDNYDVYDGYIDLALVHVRLAASHFNSINVE